MTVSKAGIELLQRNGILLRQLQVGRELHSKTAFEPPCLLGKNARWETSIRIGAFSMVHGGGEVVATSIGRYCSIAPDVVIGSNEHAMSWLTTSSLAENPHLFGWSQLNELVGNQNEATGKGYAESVLPTTIGNDVWIGRGAFIRGGVTIGDGAVIAAKSVVTSDVPPFAIFGGNPAKLIRFRFDHSTITLLQRLQWWQYSIYDLLPMGLDDMPNVIPKIQEAADSGIIQPYLPDWITPDLLYE